MEENKKKTVLITEDEPAMLEILADKFTENGITALQARNGEEGLQIALEKHSDLIVADILMPKMSGMEMLKKLREDAWGKTVPVIMLTNVSADSSTIIKEILVYQPAYYFIKSDIKLDNVVEKIKEVLTAKQPKTQ